MKKRKTIEYKIYNDKLAIYNFNQIKNYVEYKLLNPIAANRIVNGLRKQIYNIKLFPYIGKIYYPNNPNIRFLIHNKYLIFYEIQEKEKLIIIKTILHSKQNRNSLK